MQTLMIDDDAHAALEGIAAQRHQTVEEVIATLARQATPPVITQSGYVFETRNGVPLLPRLPNQRMAVDAVRGGAESLRVLSK